jgi:hypothetical protein
MCPDVESFVVNREDGLERTKYGVFCAVASQDESVGRTSLRLGAREIAQVGVALVSSGDFANQLLGRTLKKERKNNRGLGATASCRW